MSRASNFELKGSVINFFFENWAIQRLLFFYFDVNKNL